MALQSPGLATGSPPGACRPLVCLTLPLSPVFKATCLARDAVLISFVPVPTLGCADAVSPSSDDVLHAVRRGDSPLTLSCELLIGCGGQAGSVTWAL